MTEPQRPSGVISWIFFGLFYLFVFFVLLQNSFSYLDSDFGWHLKMGEQISRTGTLPDVNHENYTLFGTHWVDHEWLMNLLVYLVHYNFGYIALSAFFALIILAALLVQLRFAKKNFLANGRGLFFLLALQFFGLYASLPHLGIRMQEITVLNLILLLVIIGYFNKTKKCSVLFWLLPLFAFWASAHAGFLLGIFILGFFIFVKSVELAAKKFAWNFIDCGQALAPKQVAIFAVFSLLALAATLATPYGLRLYDFLSAYQDSFYQSHISEWQGQGYFPFVYRQLIFLEFALLYLVLVFFAAFVFRGPHRRKIDLWNFLLIAFFSFLAFKARRHFPLLVIVCLPIIVSFLVDFFNFKFNFLQKIKKRSVLNFGLIFFLAAAFTAAIVFMAVSVNFTNRPEAHYADKYPLAAIGFLRAHPEWKDYNIFNEYGWGGYLIWQYPERALFVDGRLPQYRLKDSTMLEEYLDFFNREKMLDQLKEYDISLTLLQVDRKFPRPRRWERFFFGIKESAIEKAEKDGSALIDFLAASPDWQAVYNDGLSEIFVKK